MGLTDDLSLRKALEGWGHRVVGTIGVLVRIFRTGRVSMLELQNTFGRVLDDSSLYLSKSFRGRIRDLLGRNEGPTGLAE